MEVSIILDICTYCIFTLYDKMDYELILGYFVNMLLQNDIYLNVDSVGLKMH